MLQRLEHERADALEAQTLEIKRRPNRPTELNDWAVEAAVCLANAHGGTLLVGVRDGVVGQLEALEGCGAVDVNSLRRAVYDRTSPQILVDIEIFEVSGRQLLAMHVPQGLPPHTTSSGRALIRIGKQCVPLTGQMWAQQAARAGSLDRSALLIDDATIHDIDLDAVDALRALVRQQPDLAPLSERPPSELLQRLELARDGRLTLAAALLVGSRACLRESVPEHEVVLMRMRGPTRYDARDDLRVPLLALLPRVEERLDAWLSLRTIRPRGFLQLELPDVTWEVAREAILNAVAHRDYFVRSAVVVGVHRDVIVVDSPGGFVGGITEENVLRHGYVHRNELLCQALQRLGLVNRAGLGVERMYAGLLRLGNPTPQFRASESSVTLRLPRRGSDEFAAWLVETERAGTELSTDDLIVLRRLLDVGELDRWSAASALQLASDEAAHRLADLRARGLLVARGRGRGAAYRFPAALSDRLRGRAATDVDRPLEREGVRLRLLEVLRERGSLSNADVRALSGFSRVEVLRLFHQLNSEGLIEMRGVGRGAHIVPVRGKVRRIR